MKIIGLTGGIGTGKSTVSEYLKTKGITIVDADKTAHEITEPGSPVLNELAGVFGDDIILEGDVLDRKKLASRAFSSVENTKKLEGITHGAIKEEMARQIEAAKERKEKIVFIDAPLLVESGLHKLCDAVWVVTADIDVRISRIKDRDGMTEDEITARISRQLSDSERNSYADELIDNSGGKDALYKEIEQLLCRYV